MEWSTRSRGANSRDDQSVIPKLAGGGVKVVWNWRRLRAGPVCDDRFSALAFSARVWESPLHLLYTSAMQACALPTQAGGRVRSARPNCNRDG